jgi:hypothetical protein
MKKCDKIKSHIKKKLNMNPISSNNVRHPVTKTFTPRHSTCHLTSSHLNFTQLHFTTLSFGLTPFKFPTAPFHLTSLHCEWLSSRPGRFTYGERAPCTQSSSAHYGVEMIILHLPVNERFLSSSNKPAQLTYPEPITTAGYCPAAAYKSKSRARSSGARVR